MPPIGIDAMDDLHIYAPDAALGPVEGELGPAEHGGGQDHWQHGRALVQLAGKIRSPEARAALEPAIVRIEKLIRLQVALDVTVILTPPCVFH